MKRLKAILPSLKEKKRYLVYEIESEPKLSFSECSKALAYAYFSFMGNLGVAEAGIMNLKEMFDYGLQRGIIRAKNNSLDKLRASFCLLGSYGGKRISIRSVAASGSLKKAYNCFLLAKPKKKRQDTKAAGKEKKGN